MSNGRNKKRRPQSVADGANPQAEATTDPSAGPPLWLRVALGLFAVWHLVAVFLAPLSVPPTSGLIETLAQHPHSPVRYYTDFFYLNHGYHFFGPDPPINQLVRYRVTDGVGEVVEEGEFPDKSAQRPRLFYHRHMMLADQAALAPPEIPAEEWLNLSLRAYGRHLLRRSGGERVTVEYVRHLPLSPSASRDGADPNAPELFAALPPVAESAAALAEPLPVPPPPPPEPSAAAPNINSAESVPMGGAR